MGEGPKQRKQHEKRHGGAEKPKYIQGKVGEIIGLPGGSAVKNPPANSENLGSIPGLGRSPGEGKATHSSVLAWRIPWTEEPGGLQSMESQRVRHDRVAKQHNR